MAHSKMSRIARRSHSSAQAATMENFQLASRYAKFITQSPDQSLADGYSKALKPRQNVYSRALEDFMNPPVVEFIDTNNYKGSPGDKIIIRAEDDFRLTGVKVQIFAADGSLLEAGDAVQNRNGCDWTYTATKAISKPGKSTIKATATDVPRHEGTLEVILVTNFPPHDLNISSKL